MTYTTCPNDYGGQHHFCLDDQNRCCLCGASKAQATVRKVDDDGEEENLDKDYHGV